MAYYFSSTSASLLSNRIHTTYFLISVLWKHPWFQLHVCVCPYIFLKVWSYSLYILTAIFDRSDLEVNYLAIEEDYLNLSSSVIYIVWKKSFLPTTLCVIFMILVSLFFSINVVFVLLKMSKNMFWVVARLSQRLKSTFFEIFSSLRVSFRDPPLKNISKHPWF